MEENNEIKEENVTLEPSTEVVEEIKEPTNESPINEGEPFSGPPDGSGVKDSNWKAPKQKNNKPLAIFLIILILVGVGVGAYFLIFNHEEKLANKENTVTEQKQKASPYRLSGNGLEEFDIKFLKLEDDNKNIVYSPLSIKYMLAMLNEGTSGNSHSQIEALIGDYKPFKYNNSANLSLANSLFLRTDIKASVKPDYINTLKEKYNAEVIGDDFKSTENINKWIKEKTLGLINNGLDRINPNEVLFIINALAIDQDWSNKFKGAYVSYNHTNFGWSFDNPVVNGKFLGVSEDIATMRVGASYNKLDIVKYKGGEDKLRKEVEEYYIKCYNENADQMYDPKSEYTAADVKSEVDEVIETYKSYMNKADRSTDFYFYVDDDVKVFAKDLKEYDGTTLQYVGIMPKKDSLSDYVKNVDTKKISEYIKNLKYTDISSFEDGKLTYVFGTIPKFNYDYELPLMSDLKKLGVIDVFDANKADLTKIMDGPLFIDKAIHKATIEMNQDGIKAGAVTIGGGAGNAMMCNYSIEIPVEEIDITFDRPYMYLIRDKKTGEVWFVGSVYEPTSWKDEEANRKYEWE